MTSTETRNAYLDQVVAQQERLEQLSIELTLNKMVSNHGYPREILDLHYDPRWAIRGLVVDKQLGNVFKMDRHGHIGRCYHGKRLLDRAQKLGGIERLGQVLERARLYHLDRLAYGPERGDDYNRRFCALLARFGKKLIALDAGHLHIAYHQIYHRPLAPYVIERRVAVCRYYGPVARLIEHFLKRVAQVGVVFSEQ